MWGWLRATSILWTPECSLLVPSVWDLSGWFIHPAVGLALESCTWYPSIVGHGAGNSGRTFTPETVFFQDGSCVSRDAVGTGERYSIVALAAKGMLFLERCQICCSLLGRAVTTVRRESIFLLALYTCFRKNSDFGSYVSLKQTTIVGSGREEWNLFLEEEQGNFLNKHNSYTVQPT